MSVANDANKIPNAITRPPITATSLVDFRRHNAITIDDENNDILQLAEPSHAVKESKFNFYILKLILFLFY